MHGRHITKDTATLTDSAYHLRDLLVSPYRATNQTH
jgi:hypothetical protein